MAASRPILLRPFGFPVAAPPVAMGAGGFLAVLLATTQFPPAYPALPVATHWAMAVGIVLGLYVSLVVHELGHAMLARHFGLRVGSANLFVSGDPGGAELPPSPQAELATAAAGPFASFLLTGWLTLAWGWAATSASGGAPGVRAVLGQLAVLNALFTLINLLPAFPLDGARMLRSLLWLSRGEIGEATRWSVRAGGVVGVALVVFGLLTALRVGPGHLWWAILGLFLRFASRFAWQRLLLPDSLVGVQVRRFVRRDPVAVPRAISVAQAVEEYFQRSRRRVLPVVDDGRLLGCLKAARIERLPREEWARQSAGALVEECRELIISPDADVRQAIAQLEGAGSAPLLVVEERRLLGTLSLNDLLSDELSGGGGPGDGGPGDGGPGGGGPADDAGARSGEDA